MTAINEILNTLAPVLGHNIWIFHEMVRGIFSISGGGVTQRNIARYCFTSERSVQRFMAQKIEWAVLNFILLTRFFLFKDQLYVLAIDEVVVKKAGKSTHGVTYFFSSIAQKVIRAVSFHAVSIIEVGSGDSFHLFQEQTIRKPRKKGAKQVKVKGPKKPPGRPKGSKNKSKVVVESELTRGMRSLLTVFADFISILGIVAIRHIVADGAYGNNNCLILAEQFDLFLTSKLNVTTALYLPFTGEYAGNGKPRKYGDRIDLSALDKAKLVENRTEGGYLIETYHYEKVLTKNMNTPINVAILVKTNLSTGKASYCLLFSSDLGLTAKEIVVMYGSRFAIEFNFRDGKQYFGLEDFKSTKQVQVENSVGLAFFMTNLSLLIRREERSLGNEVSILDIKAHFRADFYVQNILNTLQNTGEPIFNQEQMDQWAKIGAIQRPKKAA